MHPEHNNITTGLHANERFVYIGDTRQAHLYSTTHIIDILMSDNYVFYLAFCLSRMMVQHI